MGSTSETDSLILLARALKYIHTAQYAELMAKTISVAKMLTALLKKLRT